MIVEEWPIVWTLWNPENSKVAVFKIGILGGSIGVIATGGQEEPHSIDEDILIWKNPDKNE